MKATGIEHELEGTRGHGGGEKVPCLEATIQIATIQLRLSLEAIKPGGQISVIGILDGFLSEIPIFTLLQKQASILGMVTCSRRMFEQMNEELTKIQIRPVIDTVYAFRDARKAYDHLYRGAFAKIVIRVSA